MKSWIYILLLACLFTFCDKPQKKKNSANSFMSMGYNLSAPDKVYLLPQVLQEISGITEIDSSTIACIQDEREIVFFYDVNTNQIKKQIDCGYKGDYEGITRVGSTLYLLRSDGMLTEIKNFKSDKFERTAFASGIPWKDDEGICYEPKNNMLLITSKETPNKGSEDRDKRFIFGFSLTSGKPVQEPVFTIGLSVIDSFALANNIKVPMKDKKKSKQKEPDIRFLISDLAIHPVTGKLFLLSSADRLMFVFNLKNEIENIERLKPDLFKQPEGITFMKNGDMYISNEGKKNSASLLRFKYQPVTVVPPDK